MARYSLIGRPRSQSIGPNSAASRTASAIQPIASRAEGSEATPRRLTGCRREGNHEHQRCFHQFSNSPTQSASHPKRPNDPEHETRSKHECEIEKSCLPNLHKNRRHFRDPECDEELGLMDDVPGQGIFALFPLRRSWEGRDSIDLSPIASPRLLTPIASMTNHALRQL